MNPEFDSQLWDENPDAIMALEPDGRVLYWNRAAEKLFGYTRDEAVGSLLFSLIVPPDQAEKERRVLEDVLQRGVAVYKCVRRRKDGWPAHVNVSIKVVRDGADKIQYLFSTSRPRPMRWSSSNKTAK